jgi:predicted PurR-regulated permease PerM
MQSQRSPAVLLVTFGVAAAVLYFGKPLFIPLALAMLLSFWLVPLVSHIERLGAGRTLSVVVVCLVVTAVVAATAWVVGREVLELSAKTPEYRRNLVVKARSLRGPIGSLARANTVVEDIERELETPGAQQAEPPKVEVVVPEGPLDKVSGLVGVLIAPVGTAGAVAVLVIFMLLQREDLRDRLIRLAGTGDLTLTTSAIDDAGHRLSRYLGLQSMLCGAHGLMVGLGLWAIGLPSPLVWGVLAALLRFIPYVGPWVAAAIPIAVSVAAFPDWLPALYTAGLFIVLELISNNVLEPWVYGTKSGLSPFAVILSAFFWTLLWGLPGLFLAMPLTVCLVVAGRYVESLEFFRILFGEEAALEPEMRFYQRVLSLDANEVASLIQAAIEADGIDAVSDTLVVPALRSFARDVGRGALSRERGRRIRDMLAELFEDLPAGEPPAPAGEALVIAGRDLPEAVATSWLACLLRSHGYATTFAPLRFGPASRALDDAVPQNVCLTSVGGTGGLRARQLARQVHARRPSGRVIACLWSDSPVPGDPGRTPGLIWVRRSAELFDALQGVQAPLSGEALPPAGAQATVVAADGT